MSKQIRNSFLIIFTSEIIFWGIGIAIWYYFSDKVEEFRFENQNYLWGILIIRIFTPLFLISLVSKQRKLKKYASDSMLKTLVKGASPFRKTLKFEIFLIAMSFFIVAWANPQFGKNERKMKTSGIDIMIALDVSNSMLAKDLSKDRNRLEVAKLGVIQLLKKLKGDRVGVVVFAGTAYNFIPITNDYDYIKTEMLSIDPGMISSQGTAIGSAIETCMKSFEDESKTKKAIIVFTDGENHEDNAKDAAKDAFKTEVKVFTVGMGTPKSVPIPKDKYGRVYHTDKYGKTVLTKLNEKMLQEIAKSGGGVYERANGMSINLDGMLTSLGAIEKSTFKQKKFMEYEDRFQWFLGVGILLLMIEVFISNRVGRRIKKGVVN